jgi:hypothetical protein
VDVLARLRRTGEADGRTVRIDLGELDRDDRVGVGGNRRAGHDPQRLVRRERALRRRPRRERAGDPPRRVALGVAADREAVHGGAVERRQVGIGGGRLREHASERRFERDPFGPRGRQVETGDDSLRFVERDHAGPANLARRVRRRRWIGPNRIVIFPRPFPVGG